MITKQHSFTCVIVPVFLGILMASASEFTIQLIPPEPPEYQTVILNITGITETILFSEWYQGNDIPAANMIIRYNRGGQSNQGEKYFDGAEIYGSGSLLIKHVTKDLEGDYTVYIQGSSKSYQQTVSLKLTGSRMKTEQPSFVDFQKRTSLSPCRSFPCGSSQTPDSDFQSASMLYQTRDPSGSGLGVGDIAAIVIGIMFGILILGNVVYFVLKAKTKTPRSSVYEKAHIAGQHNHIMTLPGAREKTSQESNYEQLRHKDKSIYSTIEPGKY